MCEQPEQNKRNKLCSETRRPDLSHRWNGFVYMACTDVPNSEIIYTHGPQAHRPLGQPRSRFLPVFCVHSRYAWREHLGQLAQRWERMTALWPRYINIRRGQAIYFLAADGRFLNFHELATPSSSDPLPCYRNHDH